MTHLFPHQLISLRRHRHGESGMAMMAAIIITGLVITGATVLTFVTLSAINEQQSARARLQSMPWAETAVADLEFKLASMHIGRQHARSETPYADTPSSHVGFELWDVPTNEVPAGTDIKKTVAEYVNTGLPAPLNQAWKVTLTEPDSGDIHVGYYQILSPVENDPSKINMGRYITGAPFEKERWGTIEFVIRGWEGSLNGNKVSAPNPVTLRVVLSRISASKYMILTDEALHLGPNTTFNADTTYNFPTRLHSNNVRGRKDGIVVDSGGGSGPSFNGPRRLTTTSGDCEGVNCDNTGGDHVAYPSYQTTLYQMLGIGAQEAQDVKSGGSAVLPGSSGSNDVEGDAMPLPPPRCTEKLANVAVYRGITCVLNPPTERSYPSGAELGITSPYFGGGGGSYLEVVMRGDHIIYRRSNAPTRKDIGGLPHNNDLAAVADTYPYRPGFGANDVPRIVSNWQRYDPPPGGAAVLAIKDVVLSGHMDCNTPLTIVAARINWSRAMSIYLWNRDGTFIGSDCPQAPVGIVAQGGIYFPSFAMDAARTAGDRTPAGYAGAPPPVLGSGGTNQNLQLKNVALMTEGGFVGLGSTMMTLVQSIDPCEAQDSTTVTKRLPQAPSYGPTTNGYGQSNRLTISGSIASRRGLITYYGNQRGDCWVGFKRRTFNYVSRLSWDPPPMFPMTKQWSIVDWAEVSND